MTSLGLPGMGLQKSARFDASRAYRYELWRVWDPRLPVVAFCGLNPSTATEDLDDPTIRKCMGFARRWAAGGLLMLNAFAWRSTDPRALKTLVSEGRDPVGSNNDATIARFAADVSYVRFIVAAWGKHAALLDRGKAVAALVAMHRPIMCLGVNKDGSPEHPLYVPYERPLREYRPQGGTP